MAARLASAAPADDVSTTQADVSSAIDSGVVTTSGELISRTEQVDVPSDSAVMMDTADMSSTAPDLQPQIDDVAQASSVEEPQQQYTDQN